MDTARRPLYRTIMNPSERRRLTLRTALLVGLCGTLLLGLLPAALMLDRRLWVELERRSREELLLAPMVLKDRNDARAEALAMHADMVAAAPDLAAAVLRGDREEATAIAAATAATFPGEEPVLVGPEGDVWVGPTGAAGLAAAGATARVPVTFIRDSAGPRAVALAPIPGLPGSAAGVAAPMDGESAATLAALTRSDVVVLTPDGAVSATTVDSTVAAGVARLAVGWTSDDGVHELSFGGAPLWAVVAPLSDAGGVAFVRSVDQEMAAIPDMRRAGVLAALVAILLTAGVGALYAMALARPVRQLASAAGRLADGDFTAPLPRSAIAEVQQVAAAFESMRATLAARLEELGAANRALQDRQERLEALQTELIRQDRLVASGRLVAELTHEIRNPVANVRNCIELVRRRVAGDPEARAYADMAVEELMRMHRLAEQLLDLHRPSESGEDACDGAVVLREIAALTRAGADGSRGTLRVEAPDSLPVAIPHDALMQVLLNLVENAREAGGDRDAILLRGEMQDGVAQLEVLDGGPGIPEDVMPRIFDPFFTTKGAVSGVGLGLFVAEGIARRYGGRLRAENRQQGGARLVLELLRSPTGATR